MIALIYSHILNETPLGWFAQRFIDVPIAVSGETAGPGDDARIEFGPQHPPVEIQTKHGFTAGEDLLEFIRGVRDRSASADAPDVILVVDRSSTRALAGRFREDLQRFRGDRTDGFRPEMRGVLAALPKDSSVLRRLFVVQVDVDHASDAERKFALTLLADALEDPSQAEAAWRVLAEDAADICAKRLRQ